MATAGELECRFFWEYLNDGYLIYDRQRGAGCFGENFVATAVDGVVAEDLCRLLNFAEGIGRARLALSAPYDTHHGPVEVVVI